MGTRRLRGWLLAGLVVLAVPLAVAARAFACGGLAAVTSNVAKAAPGTTVTVNGMGFAPYTGASSPLVEIRIGTLTGPALATAEPSGSMASFSVDVTIPDMAPGDTFLVATQTEADGTTPVPGTPAREAFTVLAPPPPPPPVVTPPAPVVPPPAAVPPPPAVVADPVANTQAQASAQRQLQAAIRTCKRKYDVKKAKTRRTKRLLAHRRAACVARAHAAAHAASINALLDFSLMSENLRPSAIATILRR